MFVFVWQAPPTVCRELVTVLDLQRYSRDQGSSIYFPQAVLKGKMLDTRPPVAVSTGLFW